MLARFLTDGKLNLFLGEVVATSTTVAISNPLQPTSTSLAEYIKGYSPNLMHFGSLCMGTAKIIEFYIIISILFSFILFEYIKLTNLKRFVKKIKSGNF